MKKITTILSIGLLTFGLSLSTVFAQAPEKMSYQAVVRDAGNALVTNQGVGMQLSILQGSTSGSSVYTETQTPTTNINGLVSIEIGSGTVVTGTFNTIDWSAGPYFIKTETDPTGGASYTITGTSQLMSVPYALHASTANSIVCGLSIGDTYQGGIIFYLDASGCHGLIAAPTDQSTGLRWYAGTSGVTRATGDGLYAGETNTAIIIASQVSIGDDGSDYAAQICNDLQITEGDVTYGDWYLPSKYELNLLYLQKALVGGFDDAYYWSSTENDSDVAWIQRFTNGSHGYGDKGFTLDYVRAVRAF
jgi:hypothetical protein